MASGEMKVSRAVWFRNHSPHLLFEEVSEFLFLNNDSLKEFDLVFGSNYLEDVEVKNYYVTIYYGE